MHPIPYTGNPKKQILFLCKIEYESISKTLARTLFNKPYFWELSFQRRIAKIRWKNGGWRLHNQPFIRLRLKFNSIQFTFDLFRLEFNLIIWAAAKSFSLEEHFNLRLARVFGWELLKDIPSRVEHFNIIWKFKWEKNWILKLLNILSVRARTF